MDTQAVKWKVRIHTHAGIVHVVSGTEPRVKLEGGRISTVEIDYVTGHDGGDTIGFIDWCQVSAITWKEENPDKSNAKATKEAELDDAILISGGEGCSIDVLAQNLGITTRSVRNRIEGYFGNGVSKKWKIVGGKVLPKTVEIDI